MGLKKKPPTHPDRTLPDNIWAELLPPNLWTGAHGFIEGYRDGKYVVRVCSIHKTSFQVAARSGELNIYENK